MKPHHKTKLGEYYVGSAETLLRSKKLTSKYKPQLILTSPPFPLNRKKKYGNKSGQDYVDWLSNFAPLFSELLTEDGSVVIELGNGWQPGRPVQSLLTLEALMSFVNHKQAKFRLCQEFVSYNPSRMPSPAQWVTVQKCRVTDSFTHIWWMSKSDFPKADSTKVLRPYSPSMKKLLKTRTFNAGDRPSGHRVRDDSFKNDNGGAIAHNFFELEDINTGRRARLPNVFSFSNTTSSDYFSRICREKNITPHPARMHQGIANFFIQFLTDPGDLVLDPFAGSNTTGFVAELHQRRWISIDQNSGYALQSQIRLNHPELKGQSIDD